MVFHSLRYQQLMPINLHYLLQKLRNVLSNLEKQVCPSAMYAVQLYEMTSILLYF